MRVLQPGRNPDDDLLTGTCENCGCVVQFYRREAQAISNHDWLTGFETLYHIDCPTPGCGYTIKAKQGKSGRWPRLHNPPRSLWVVN